MKKWEITEKIQMVNKYMRKKCSASVVFGEMHIQTQENIFHHEIGKNLTYL